MFCLFPQFRFNGKYTNQLIACVIFEEGVDDCGFCFIVKPSSRLLCHGKENSFCIHSSINDFNPNQSGFLGISKDNPYIYMKILW